MLILSISFCTIPWWLLALLPFLLGLLAGWLLWAKYKSQIDEVKDQTGSHKTLINGLESDIDGYKIRIAKLEAEIQGCNGRLSALDQGGLSWKEERADLNSQIALLQGQLKERDSNDSASSESDDWEAEREDLHNQIALLEGQLSAKDSSANINTLVSPSTDETSNASTGKATSIAAGFAAGALTSSSIKTAGIVAKGEVGRGLHAYAKALGSDNLQIVEGIGTKMSELLKGNGIDTWSHLAAQTPEGLRALLDSVNESKYRIIDPSTWAQQASLAAADKWDALIELQKNLDGGKDTGGSQTNAKVEKMLIKKGEIRRWEKDDLTAIEGIGPKTAQLLKDKGIETWQALSETTVDTIQEILNEAGSRFKLSDPGTWPKQAGMAARKEWDELQAYQDFLGGGKE